MSWGVQTKRCGLDLCSQMCDRAQAFHLFAASPIHWNDIKYIFKISPKVQVEILRPWMQMEWDWKRNQSRANFLQGERWALLFSKKRWRTFRVTKGIKWRGVSQVPSSCLDAHRLIELKLEKSPKKVLDLSGEGSKYRFGSWRKNQSGG